MLDYFYYTFVYVLLFFSIVFLSGRNNDKKFCYLAGTIISLFAGLSYDVGWDYVIYMDMMKGQMEYERIELLEQSLLLFSKKIQFPQLFFIVNHFIIVFCNVLAIKKSSTNVYLSVLLFLCLPLSFLLGISTIRAAVAASIMFFAYEYFLKEKKPWYFLLCGIACFFIHEASIIFVMMLVVYYIEIPLWVNVSMFVAASVLSVGQLTEISWLSSFAFLSNAMDRYDYYTQNANEVASKIPYIYYMINVLNLLFYKKLSKENNAVRQYIVLFNIGCCLSLLFSFNHTICLRLSRFYYSWIVLLLPYYCSLPANIQYRTLAKRIIVVLCFLLFMYQLYLPNYNGIDHSRTSTYWPYQLFFLAE